MSDLLKKFFSLLMILAIGIVTACSPEEGTNEKDEDKIQIVTTIAQIGEPLSVIGEDYLQVESLMGPSVDPHLYNPTQSDIKKVADAELIFYNGLTLEANMVEVFDSIRESKPVLAIGETVPEAKLLFDEDGAIDPHIWFDIDLWQLALDAAVEEIKAYAPEIANELEENKQQYFAELEKLKEESKVLADIPEKQRYLITAHDAFGYFGRMHDLEVIGLQGLSTEDEIGISDINHTIEIIKEYAVPAIFVESSISQDSIKAVIEGAKSDGIDVELGGELFSDAMGEPGTEEGTYLGMYRHNVNTIYQALTRGVE